MLAGQTDQPDEREWIMTVSLLKLEHAERCTCCAEPRPITRVIGDSEWMHAADEMFATTLHAHVNEASSDCDGPFYRDYVQRPNDYREGVLDDPSSEYDFKDQLVSGMASWFSLGGRLDVDERGASWTERTDEGGRSKTVRWCEDADCAYEGYHQRDVYAERMGY